MKRCDTTLLQGIREKAGDWYLRREAGLTGIEATELEAWLAADPRHREAWLAFSRTWHELHQARKRGMAEFAIASLAARRARRRRRRSMAGAAALAALILVVIAPFGQRAGAPDQPFPSSVAVRPDQQTLPDGSTIELNAGAEFAIEFTPDQRGIRLLAGEALFSIKKDPARPFVVTAGEVAIRAVGTEFSVRRSKAQVEILVTEGRVAVQRALEAGHAYSKPEGGAEATLVDAGVKLTVPAGVAAGALPSPIAVTSDDMSTLLAWRDQRIEFTETSLQDVLALFNRRNSLELRASDPAVAELEVTGIFWANDPEAFVRVIETGLSLRAERRGDVVELRRR